MTFARTLWPLILLATAAACSGNIGGGQSTLPGAPPNGSNVQQIAPVAATPTPSSASNVATMGDSVAPQLLPSINGWGGTIAFPHPSPAPTPTPNPKASGTPAAAATPVAVQFGITSSVVEPSDAPHFSSGAKHKHDPGALTPLLFVSLLATSDVTTSEYPRIAIDVPREIAAKHHNDTYALALYDPQAKSKAYALAVAERDFTSPLPGTLPTAVPSTPTPTPVPTPTSSPFGLLNGPPVLTPPPLGSGNGNAGLPPEHVAFKATPATLTFKANQPVVFALYAIPPQPSPSPSPTPKAGASASPAPTASPSGSPAAQATVGPGVTPAASPGASARPADRP